MIANEDENLGVAFSGDDRTVLFHNHIYAGAQWEQERQNEKPGTAQSPPERESVSKTAADINFVNHLLENSWTYAEVELQ